MSPADYPRLHETMLELFNDEELREQTFENPINILERRLSEIGRQRKLENVEIELQKIDQVREQKLVSMAVPLVKEMATAFRRSADTLRINTEGHSARTNVFYLDPTMVSELSSITIDTEITPILGNIIQYNKENGWGKVRLSISRHPLSFSVPSDQKKRLQNDLLFYMGRDQAYLQLYIVRDKAREPVRVIVAGILETPE